VIVTDEAQRKRKSVTDALGRLKEIYEDPNGLNYLTSYSYDTLDNLTTVSQGVQTRTFVYDSLKRLTAATNPESGTVTYQYDPNGNLVQKTDARGVVSNYTYDALNRNTRIVYTNDPAGTPAVNRYYDGAKNGANNNIPNSKGRWWQTETSGPTASRTTINSFDALGRPLSESQQFFANGAWSQPYNIERAPYNLAGALTSQTYPSGHIVTYTYDGAGRVNGFTGSLGDGTQRSYATAISYSPLGGMTKEKFGTDTAIYNKLYYNSRGQLAEVRETTSDGGPGDISWNRGKFVNWYSLQCGGLSCNAADNNGNLRRQETFVPNNEQNTSSTSWYQQYEYDSLNRLTETHEHASNNALLWRQSYSYDRYGNRSINIAGTTQGIGINSTPASVVPNTTTNRLYGPGETEQNHPLINYDNAGNQTKDYTSSGVRYDRSYDAQNRMTASTASDSIGSQTSTYTYDGDGRRVRRKVNGVETWQVYGIDGELLAEYVPGAAPVIPQKEYGYRNGQLLITAVPATGQRVNFARENNPYAYATASSSFSLSFTPNATNNGDRKGQNWGSGPLTGSGWMDATANTYPDWLQVDFNMSRTIDEIDVFTIQDNWMNPIAPTESMTFAAQGITNFDVQYWNGTTWLTVPGGSITGNNKVWRKLTFPAVTASRIRVVVNAALAGQSRIVELEAWGTTGGNAFDLKWLVTDQLGSPRMVLDKSGALATVKRHDYLPFGEELLSGQGARSTTLGYSGSDGIRQKFTQKERDNENGLDYFISRYYSSTQGRFVSADSVSGFPMKPQTFNLFSYVLNNPLKFIDPKGHKPQTQRERPSGGDAPPCWPYCGLYSGQAPGVTETVTVNIQNETPVTTSTEIAPQIEMRPIVPLLEDTPEERERRSHYGTPDGLPDEHVARDNDDFRRINFSYSPKALVVYGLSMSFTWDKYGNHYLSLGPSVGLNSLSFGGSIQTGQTFLNGQHVRDEQSVQGILTGPSASINACASLCFNTGWNTTDFGFYPRRTGGQTISSGIGLPELTYTKDWTWKLPF
jgi:RHS repeat-associated protein